MDKDHPSSPPPNSAIPRHSRSFFTVPRRGTIHVPSPPGSTAEESDDYLSPEEGPSVPSWIPSIPEWEEDFAVEGVPSWVPDLPTLSECGPDATEEVSDDEVVQQKVGRQNVADGEVHHAEVAEEGLKDTADEVGKDDGHAQEGNVSSDFEELDPNDMRIWESDTDEDVIVDESAYRRGKKVIKMDPTYDYEGKQFRIIEGEDIKFEVRDWFVNSNAVRNAVRDYAVRGGYKLRFIKNDTRRITVSCSSSCPWRMHTSALSGQHKFMVKTLNDVHTCMKVRDGYWATPKWIARQIDNLLGANQNLDNKTLKAALKKFGCTLEDWKLYKAKALHKLNTHGTHVESYAKLAVYCEKLRELNPGSIVVLQGLPRASTSEGLKFGRVFVCLGGVKDGFIHGCRPFLGLDGCHLKGPFGGTLLAAVSRDANSKILPIAWAIVDKENGQNWEWFIHLLYTAVGSHASGKALTIMTDGQKGLGDQIEAFIPNSRHRRCVKHIGANFFQTFRGTPLEHFFWGMVYATTRTRFNRRMAELKLQKFPAKKVGKDMITPAQWLEKIPASKWSVHAFDEYVKCVDVTNNLVESFNNWVGKLRGLPIVDLLEGLRIKMMRKWHSRYEMACNCTTRCAPIVMDQLRRLSEECRSCEIIPTRNYQYEVINEGVREAVDLLAKKCSCNLWQLSGIPCIHAAAIFTSGEGRMENGVDKYYKLEMWEKTYEYPIYPFPDTDLEPIEGLHERYHPPFLTRRSGRPRKHNRKRQEGEKKPMPRSNFVKCAICGVLGHNKRSCMGAQTKAKGKRPMQPTRGAGKHGKRPRNKKGANATEVVQEVAAGASQVLQEGEGPSQVLQEGEGSSRLGGEDGASAEPAAAKFVPRRGRGRGRGRRSMVQRP